MAKTTSINLRISPDFREEIESLAAYHGLSMSSFAHSLLVKAVRREREETPEAFAKQRGIRAAEVHLAPVVATIGSGREQQPTRADVQKMVSGEQIDEMKERLKPKKRKAG